LFQGIVDKLEKDGTPTKANHWLRYLRRLYSYALRRTSIQVNPCKGVQQAHERKRRRVPTEAVYRRALEFARTAGERKAHSRGSLSGYLWMAMELMYLCRLRSVEVITLTDAHATESGLMTNRRKGSRDNIVAWTPRLQVVWKAAMDRRKRLWSKPGTIVPMDPAMRVVLVGDSGQPLKPNTVQLAWSNLMRRMIKDKAITPKERFTTHGCKHKGITDSPGNRHDKQQASGHRSERMMDVYDHEVPIVPTSERKTP
jgi:site-specific recombinase XerC